MREINISLFQKHRLENVRMPLHIFTTLILKLICGSQNREKPELKCLNGLKSMETAIIFTSITVALPQSVYTTHHFREFIVLLRFPLNHQIDEHKAIQ